MRTTLRSGLWALLLVVTAGCGDDPPPPVEQRKELLRPDETRRRRIEERERQRIFDQAGELIPSGELVAQLELPKGVKLYRELDPEYFLEAPRITIEQLERYFAPRLEPTGVTRTATSVTFEGARIKANPTARVVTLRLARVDSTEPATEMMLRMAPAPRIFPSEAEVERQLAEQRKYAQ